MVENTYEYECMRAELLGVEKPNFEEYESKRKEKISRDEEEITIENLKEAENVNENLKNVSGGLYELANILSSTQKKLNRFKASCGSLTNILKVKIGGASTSTVSNADPTSVQDSNGPDNIEPHSIDLKKSELGRALDNHVDKLDLLIDKAEHCQYSMSEQNKQMNKFLR